MTKVWLLPSSILNKTPTRLWQKIGYESGSLWTICLQVCMQTINETMDYLFEFAWSLKLCLISIWTYNSQDWRRWKNKKGNVCFWTRPVIKLVLDALRGAISTDNGLFSEGLNCKNISFNSASLRNFFLCCSTAVISSCESRHASLFSRIPWVRWFVPTVTIDCSFILVFFVAWFNKFNTSWSALQNWLLKSSDSLQNHKGSLQVTWNNLLDTWCSLINAYILKQSMSVPSIFYHW